MFLSPQGCSDRATSLHSVVWGMVAYLILQESDNNRRALGFNIFFFPPEKMTTRFSLPVRFS